MKYGIALQAVVQMRSQPGETSELVNQALFGEHFRVLQQKGSWARIQLGQDGYEGWADLATLEAITEMEFQCLNDAGSSPAYACQIINRVKNTGTGEGFYVPAGSVFPAPAGQAFTMKGIRFELTEGNMIIPGTFKRQSLPGWAVMFIHAPYLWGGKTYFGMDCSGFIQLIAKLSGIRIPRDTPDQITSGETIHHPDAAEPGDLCFFHKGNEKVSHVALYLGKHEVIHASGRVRVDDLSPEGILHKTAGTLTHRLLAIKRL